MRLTLLSVLIFVCSLANATNYYFSSSGNDGAAGTSPAAAWQTIAKFNSFFSSFVPGDSVLFKRGDIFSGAMTISRSGISASPIIIGAYGTGTKPVITALNTVSGWTNSGSNLWISNSAVSTLASVNMVVINAVNTPIGRWPNTGYRTIGSHVSNTSITDPSLPATPNWTGAEVVIRRDRWTIDRNPITSHVSHTLNYVGTGYNAIDGFGYFIQNSVTTLDTQNEWYYNPTTKKIQVYSTTTPSNVQVSTITDIVTMAGRSYIKFTDIAFQGANGSCFKMSAGSNHITIQNCDIDYSGNIGVEASSNCSYITISTSTINHSNDKGIFTDYAPNITVTGCSISNSGQIPGMGYGHYGAYTGILAYGGNSSFTYNNIINSGYVAIEFGGNNTIVNYNYIDTFGNVADDCGGIYTWNDAANPPTLTGRQISHNIILNGIGATAGTDDPQPLANGIYTDDNSMGITIDGNSISNIADGGIFIHNAHDLIITNNTVYDCFKSLYLAQDDIPATPSPIANLTITGNIFFAKYNTQRAYGIVNRTATGVDFGTYDNNYITRPIDESASVEACQNNCSTFPYPTYNLSGWKSLSGEDVNSNKAPRTVTTVNDLRFEYNETSVNKTISLGANYIDVRNTPYPGTITLAPNTSAVLIKTSAGNIPPTANAGSDQTITLPVNSVTLSGSGTDPDGTITAYLWTKISGPAAGNITNPNAASTSVTGLVQGVYNFELKVTDNNGAVGRDTMQVTVNPAANIPPTANAGQDQTITLPVNSVTLSGSGTDPDGTITAYLWTKISGPAAGNITNPNAAASSVTGLVQGVYNFELKVTDNNGAVGRDTMQVTVNPAANIPPTANAGQDQTITLPVNSVTLSGSGTDPDGTITAYLWTKIAGPAAGNITNPNAASTSVTGLVQGVYNFELKVTDNNGAVGRDTMQVTVNPAANIPPTANAGQDQTITLPVNSVTLSGSGTDPDGTITAYLWTKIAGPAAGNITNPNAASTSVTGLVQGVYNFELKVTDNNGAVGRDTMQVTVNPAANIPPTANAGQDQTITLPVNSVTLSGSGTDPDGTITAYLWTKIAGPAAGNITNPNAASTSVTGLVQGVYNFELKVTDNNGAVGRDTMQVTVNPAANIPPTANAGQDQTITLPVNSVTLSGSGTDPDGTITAYLWTKISGPAAGNITNPNAAASSVTGLVQGVYNFELKVTDNNGAVGRDTMQVTVNPAANIPPTANAGSDQTITLPVNSVTLSGSGTDPDGTITAYLWTKIAGPAAGNITNPNAASTSVTGLVQGVYNFELKVTDNNGAVGRDTMQVTVNPAANIPPTANAGQDQTITLPVNSVTLSGSGTDPDGTITAYLWTKIAGPAAGNITNPNAASTSVTGLVQGVYNFELKVTDNNGAVGRDTMQVTVNPAVNIPPTANAGSDQTITLPDALSNNTVILSGSGTDPDGTITAYLWTKISGPAAGNITNPNAASTSVTGLVQGVYNFELKVTDNNGDVGSDVTKISLIISANILPAANAGSDQTITFPNNATSLTGSGTDIDGTIVGYDWKQISGPSSNVLFSLHNAVTFVNNLLEGTYQFELTVTDNRGGKGMDTVSVVMEIPHIAIYNNSIKIYPNPVVNLTTLEITKEKVNTKVLMLITDMLGRTICTKELTSPQNNFTEKVNLSNLAKDIYLVTVFFDDTEKKTIKVIKTN